MRNGPRASVLSSQLPPGTPRSAGRRLDVVVLLCTVIGASRSRFSSAPWHIRRRVAAKSEIILLVVVCLGCLSSLPGFPLNSSRQLAGSHDLGAAWPAGH